MERNVFELLMNDKAPESIDEIISKALKIVECKPIIKKAIGKDWKHIDGEVYLDDNDKALVGYLAFQEVLFHERGIDGSSIEVYKDIFLTPRGEHKVFFTSIEINYDSYRKTNQCKINRIFPAFQTLSLDEEEEFIWNLMFEIKNHENY